MSRDASRAGLFGRLKEKFAGFTPGGAVGRSGAGSDTPDAMEMLEAIQAGRPSDYCLYVGPTGMKATRPDLEDLLARGFEPLPWLPLDAYKSPLRRLPTEGRLAEEAFGTLASHARVLLVVPTERAETITRLRWITQQKHLWRCLFLMPDSGAFGVEDWSATWQSVQRSVASIGLDLPPYTAGGWLFRYEAAESPPRACTFRMIAHPNPEKIAAALEAICGEMSPDQSAAC